MYKLLKCYVVRLYSEGTISDWTSFNIIWRLSVLCDKNNLLSWGADDNTKMIRPDNKSKIIDTFNKDLTKEQIQLKQDLLTAIEENDIELAKEKVKTLLQQRGLDREGLYFKMYIEAFCREFSMAVLVAEVARVFWGEDEEIASMINMVYAEIEKE